MTYLYEQLANAFVKIPVEVYGIYRQVMEAGHVVNGHLQRPTSKCAVLVGLRGQADFIFDKTEVYKLMPGGGFIGGIGKRLEVRAGTEGFEYLMMHFIPEHSGQALVHFLTEVSPLRVELTPEFLQLQEQILRVASVPDSMGKLEKKSLFYQILDRLLQSERDLQNQKSFNLIEDAISYIQTHYAEPLTLNKLAARYQMQGKYFSYVFRKYVGMAPIDYLIRYRMNKAEELLVSTDASIHQIAETVGYSDPNYFSRVFRQYAGISPKQSREQRRLK